MPRCSHDVPFEQKCNKCVTEGLERVNPKKFKPLFAEMIKKHHGLDQELKAIELKRPFCI